MRPSRRNEDGGFIVPRVLEQAVSPIPGDCAGSELFMLRAQKATSAGQGTWSIAMTAAQAS